MPEDAPARSSAAGSEHGRHTRKRDGLGEAAVPGARKHDGPDKAAALGIPAGLSPQEEARRRALLAAIARRVAADGPHTACAHADRARQFMPFAALKGYHELAHDQEHDDDQT